MSGISLTASMRSNLLSLQNIASRQDIVQNRLATGLKVSSAIDNPSSYYTASSLNNRAADLTALLDAMSQGIQTIKAASEAIDSGTKFLEQAKAVANQALETAIPAKEWFAEQVGENGAVVETAQELLDAVNSGKETIVVYGKIDLGDISDSGGLKLAENQKLVGVGYFGNFDSETDKFSQIISRDTSMKGLSAVMMGNGSLVADLTIEYSARYLSNNGTVMAAGISGAVLRDVEINFKFAENYEEHNNSGSVVVVDSQISLEGNINLNSEKHGVHAVRNSTVIMNAETRIETRQHGLYINNNSRLELSGKFFSNNKQNSVLVRDNSVLDVLSGSEMYILSSYTSFVSGSSSGAFGSRINFGDGVKIYHQNGSGFFAAQGNLDIRFGTGVQFSTADKSWKSMRASFLNLFPGDALKNFDSNSDFIATAVYIPLLAESEKLAHGRQNWQYNLILQQYDTLVSDSFYKGINLLSGQNLKVNFNEDRRSKIEVAGVKADSGSLGIAAREWKNIEDIEKSVSELEEAINTLRSFASAFGNYYSIVTTRQDFTENLINVLEEGADKLTLADMNQESANMLALQTSQQLAVNSLSLAGQASQAILRLF